MEAVLAYKMMTLALDKYESVCSPLDRARAFSSALTRDLEAMEQYESDRALDRVFSKLERDLEAYRKKFQEVVQKHLAAHIQTLLEEQEELRQERDELDVTAKRYRSERDAMRIAVIDALDNSPQGKHTNKFRARFAYFLKNAHEGIEILQTPRGSRTSHATSELIKLLDL